MSVRHGKMACICIWIVCVLITAGIITCHTSAKADGEMNSSFEIVTAQMPTAIKKPKFDSDAGIPETFEHDFDVWWAAQTERQETVIPNRGNMDRFFQSGVEVIMNKIQGENLVFSPLNLWFALHLLSSASEDSSRTKVISALLANNQEELDEQAAALWLTQYWNDGESSCIPNASIWLADGILTDSAALEKLTEVNHASVFQGKMGSPELNQAFQAWINRCTAGLFSDLASSMMPDQSVMMSIFTTLYYRSNWSEQFISESNEMKVFHALSGDVTREFMCQSVEDQIYYGNLFSACMKPLEDGKAVFILPDEGIDPETLFQDGTLIPFLCGGYQKARTDTAMVNFSMPKLDCTAAVSLRKCLEALGITDLFQPELADFSAILADENDVYLSDVSQYTRLIIDEEGIAAAAVTRMLAVGAAMSQEREIDFCLDRPFAFAILGQQNIPLFLGVIHQP